MQLALASAPRPTNQMSTLLGDHDDRCVRVARGHLRHDGRIDDSQIPYAVHTQLVIDHGQRVTGRAHLARTGLMVLRTGVLSYGTLPVFLRRERNVH